MNLQELADSYQNTPEWHGKTFDLFHQNVLSCDWLNDHRDWCERNSWGLNDKAHHWLWKIIVETLPDDFVAAEIGVFRGQTVSLIGLIANHLDKIPTIYGVSPFAATKDSANEYPQGINYLSDVRTVFEKFGVPSHWFAPIFGLSQSSSALCAALQFSPYDALYIDGSHVYEAIRQDIINYAPMVKKGGLLVVDDCSCHLNMPEFTNAPGYNRCWAGIGSVSDAVRDFLEPREDFKHLFAIGHVRVWRRV